MSYITPVMFTKPEQRVRVTARDYRGCKPGKSKSVTVYGTTAEEVLAKLLGSDPEEKNRGKKKTA